MEGNITDILAKYAELRALVAFATKMGVQFRAEFPTRGYAWYFDPDPPRITVPVDKKWQCILPIDDSPMLRKFRLAHELGHADGWCSECPNEQCSNLRHEGDWCFYKERKAWINGLAFLLELKEITLSEREQYLSFALQKLKTQTKHCIRDLCVDPTKIF
jgi:hypothetical protein